MKKAVDIKDAVYTHEFLWRSSTYLLHEAEKSDATYRQLIPALLMAFLAYEAFVNFLGHVLAPESWMREKENFQGKGLEGKVQAIVDKLPSFHWEKGKQPYQTIKELERYRNMVAHGKVIASQYAAEEKDDGTHFRFQHDWDEFLSVDSIREAQVSIQKFSHDLLEAARKVSDEPHLKFDAYQGSLVEAMGISRGG